MASCPLGVWHQAGLLSLLRGAVDAPFLEVFKARLEGALGSLSWRGTALPVEMARWARLSPWAAVYFFV